MKFYTFNRESDNFDDILTDPVIRRLIKTRISWTHNLMIGLSSSADASAYGYIVLKYGDDIVNPVNKDFTPVPNVDYTPIRR